MNISETLNDLSLDPPHDATVETGGLLQKLRNAITSNSERIIEMEKKRVEAVEIIKGMALKGQSTAIYMEQNGGKTLVTIAMIIDTIRSGKIDGAKVYYINADDTYEGGVVKSGLARDEGFNLVLPDSKEGALSINEVVPLLVELSKSGQASEYIFIVDTLKKIVDMMQKRSGSDFGKVSRSFVQAGGTLITLGHVNKHKGDDGKAVFEGTGDIVNDFDCAYVGTIDTAKDDPNRQITFENIKLRGPVEKKVSLSYNADPKTPWLDKLKSVSMKSSAEAAKIRQLNEYHEQLDGDLKIVLWIYDFLAEGSKLQTAIKTGGCPDAGQLKVEKTLKHYGNMHPQPEFRFWTCQVGDKNARIYSRTINNPNDISEAWKLGV